MGQLLAQKKQLAEEHPLRFSPSSHTVEKHSQNDFGKNIYPSINVPAGRFIMALGVIWRI
jgi:hypothetical protein